MPEPKIMIVAGEASGDQRGAEVCLELVKQNPNITLFGIGGKEMRAAGVNTHVDVEQLAVMGFIEPIKHLPRILKIFSKMKQLLISEKPDLLILVDYPGFNLRLAKVAKSFGIKVLFYISPQVWAWRQNRVKKIAQVVDHMAVLFPFEEKFYQGHNIPVTYVGHPLTQKIKKAPSLIEARQQLHLSIDKSIITLMPGSRNSEVEKLLPLMLESAYKIAEQKTHCQFVIALASTINHENIESQLQGSKLNIQVSDNSLLAVMAADAVITASGTATLETALLNKPMVIVYKVNRLSAAIAKRVIKIPHISLCNIVAEKEVVKEFLQQNATADNVANEIIQILNNEDYRNTMINHLKDINKKLGDMQAAENVANVALTMIGNG